VKKLSAYAPTEGENKIWMDGKTVNYALYSCVTKDIRLEKESPITIMKACKNEAELAGMRECHYRDGAAECEFFAWLEEELTKPNGKLWFVYGYSCVFHSCYLSGVLSD
jgi:Xaa-Pro aminopeptidase